MILFVGEERSDLAVERGWTWKSGRLAAKQLFDALALIGIDPAEHRFVNWFESSDRFEVYHHEGPVVAMGRKVQRALTAKGIEHIPLVHPAARGKIRAKGIYAAHVAEMLGGLA